MVNWPVCLQYPIPSKSAPEALATLKEAGLRIVMATGDGLTTARSVAARQALMRLHGEVKPADKLELVSKLQKQGRIVANGW